MAFIANLPTWPLTLTPYLAQDDGTWIAQPTIPCQLYTMKRVAEVEGFEAMYVVYPKEEGIFRDTRQIEYRVDAAAIDCGDQGVRWYWVWQVEPRWAGFPNRHWLALISQMTPADVQLVLNGPPPTPGPGELAIAAPSNGTCTDCGDLAGSYPLTHMGGDVWQSAAFSYLCSATTAAIWTITKTSTYILAVLSQDDFAADLVSYYKVFSGSPGPYPLIVNYYSPGSAETMCDWPANVAINLSGT